MHPNVTKHFVWFVFVFASRVRVAQKEMWECGVWLRRTFYVISRILRAVPPTHPPTHPPTLHFLRSLPKTKQYNVSYTYRPLERKKERKKARNTRSCHSTRLV